MKCTNSMITVIDCIFSSNSADSGGGVYCYNSAVDISGCTFSDNSGGMSGGGMCCISTDLLLNNTIIAFSSQGEGIYCDGVGDVTLTCCDVYGNADGHGSGFGFGYGNITEDPLFCAPHADDFRLRSDSPCAPGNSPGGCGLIGALGVACDVYYESPGILSILDVGNDQGRQVRITWQRSLYDAPGETTITGYDIYRRQDEYLMTLQATAEPGPIIDEGVDAPQLSGWDYIVTVTASGDSAYQYVAPTLCDSTVAEGVCWSVFYVSALTDDPLTHFDSAPDSGYSVDNLAPAPPPNFRMTSPTELAWDESPEEDFNYFAVYGSANADLDSTAVLIRHTISTTLDISEEVYAYYHITATDFAGNEGDASSIGNTYAGLLPDEMPTAYALMQNRPNPFEATTVIRFDLPEPGIVHIVVYDVSGRLIQSLTDQMWSAGRHSMVWHGTDDLGKAVGPGIYLLRMEAGEFRDTKKMLILR